MVYLDMYLEVVSVMKLNGWNLILKNGWMNFARVFNMISVLLVIIDFSWCRVVLIWIEQIQKNLVPMVINLSSSHK